MSNEKQGTACDGWGMTINDKTGTNTAPSLPYGMRLADHDTYGRCVVSPKKGKSLDAYWCVAFSDEHDAEKITFWSGVDEMDFVDTDTGTPEALETIEDYVDAPPGTIVSKRRGYPLIKEGGVWLWVGERKIPSDELAGSSRRILRWGDGK